MRCECDRWRRRPPRGITRPRGKIERVRFVSAGDVRPSVAPAPKHASHAPKKKNSLGRATNFFLLQLIAQTTMKLIKSLIPGRRSARRPQRPKVAPNCRLLSHFLRLSSSHCGEEFDARFCQAALHNALLSDV
jgi:hypothetical protein